jgi:hypothetical protein
MHRSLPFTGAEGLGARAFAWVRGCAIGGIGCCSPGIWHPTDDYVATVEAVESGILAAPNIEGVSVIGRGLIEAT